jgi:predicted nuclease of predicted toxin-antitoxin system
VLAGLRQRGIEARSVADEGLVGANDLRQLEHANFHGSVLVTHDRDFPRLHSVGIEHAGIAYCH